MPCDRCDPEVALEATRIFEVPGASLVLLCDGHARSPGPGAVELVRVELVSSDLGVVADLVARGPEGGTTFLVPRDTFGRWSDAQAAWEDAQAEMTTELSKATVDALELTSKLTGSEGAGA